jgi:hypothetical protein
MADLEQVAGSCTMKISQGDDVNVQFSVPFNISGYTFLTTVHAANNGTYNIITAATAQTSVLGVIQTTFQASVTSTWENTDSVKIHSWKMDYTDAGGLKRRFLSGSLEIV